MGSVSVKGGLFVDLQVDVEVCELTMDDDEFSSTFGSGASQFAELVLARDETADDPWASRLRLD
jgi:hypothetical protein